MGPGASAASPISGPFWDPSAQTRAAQIFEKQLLESLGSTLSPWLPELALCSLMTSKWVSAQFPTHSVPGLPSYMPSLECLPLPTPTPAPSTLPVQIPPLLILPLLPAPMAPCSHFVDTSATGTRAAGVQVQVCLAQASGVGSSGQGSESEGRA